MTSTSTKFCICIIGAVIRDRPIVDVELMRVVLNKCRFKLSLVPWIPLAQFPSIMSVTS